MRGYPRRFLPLLLGAIALAWVSGMLLAPTTLVLRAGWPLPWRLAPGARLGVAALHAAAAFAMLFLCGALWSLHMRIGWRRRGQRRSGASMALLQLVLALTALAIYYAGDDTIANAGALLHLGAGVLLALPLAWHWRRAHVGRRTARRGAGTVPLVARPRRLH